MTTDNALSLNGTATTWPEVLTLAEAAAFVRLSESTLDTQLSAGQMPGRRVDDQWRIALNDLKQWLRGSWSPSPSTSSKSIDEETPEQQEAFLEILRNHRDEIDRATGYGEYAPQ